MTSVVSKSIVVGEEPHPIVRCNEVRILLNEVYDSMKSQMESAFSGGQMISTSYGLP